jgi:hypothetical protein
VVRIANRSVFQNLEGIVIAIAELAAAPPPANPLPQGEGESSLCSSSSPSITNPIHLDV